MESARFLRRRVRFSSLEVHPHLKALVVGYRLEAHVLDDSNSILMSEHRTNQKLVHLTHLEAADEQDLKPLVRAVLEQCHLIHESKEAELEQILFYLRRRKEKQLGHNNLVDTKNANTMEPYPMQLSSRPTSSSSSSITEELANLNHLEQYMEMLYEEGSTRLRGSQLLLQLAKNPDNLDEMAANEPLIGSLSRVLREDGRDERVLEVITNIVYIFFCFSTFTDFHDSVLAINKVGSLVMDMALFHVSKVSNEWSRALREQLLRVSLYLLLNLAEDLSREEKMRRKGIIGMLNAVLKHCKDNDLLILALIFLKKLSVRKCNVQQMKDTDTSEICLHLLDTQNEEVSNAVLRLLFNLSFDADMRRRMSQLPNLITMLTQALKKDTTSNAACSLLYHLSMEERAKGIMANSELVAILMRIILETNDESIPLELMSLTINLAVHRRCASLMLKGAGLQMLMQRAFHYQDALVMKLVRNLSQHGRELKHKFVDFLADIADAVQKTDNFDFRVECLGTLANLDLENIDFRRLLEEYDLLSFLKTQLVQACNEQSKKLDKADDLVLEAVMFLGTCCIDVAAASLMIEERLISVLIELLKSRQEDDEVVLQVVYVLLMLSSHSETIRAVVEDEEAVVYLLDLLHDKNREVQRVCDQALKRIGDVSEEWRERVKRDNFEFHNAQWLQIIADGEQRHYHHLDDEHRDFEDNGLIVKDRADLDSLYLQGPPSDLDLLSTTSTASSPTNDDHSSNPRLHT